MSLGKLAIGQLSLGDTGRPSEVVAQPKRVPDLMHHERLQRLPYVTACRCRTDGPTPGAQNGAGQCPLPPHAVGQAAEMGLSIRCGRGRILQKDGTDSRFGWQILA